MNCRVSTIFKRLLLIVVEIMAESSTRTSAESSISFGRTTTVFNAKFEVEKFDGTNNFGMWQCEVMDVLYQQELDIALEDKPNDMGEKQWTRINRQACSTIRLCLAKDQKYFVMKETSAKALWQKLEDKYKNVKNRLYLKMQLYCFQFKRGISMIEHLDSFNKIIADLLNLDVEINDEDKTLLLLNSLPDTYDHLTTTLLHGKDKINFVDVSNALVNNECHLFGEEPGLSLPYQAHRRPKSGSIMFEK